MGFESNPLARLIFSYDTIPNRYRIKNTSYR
jgi:hypothetical protein